MSPGSVIEASGLRRTFEPGGSVVHALCDVDMRIKRGEYVALMGPSGSGKSTLMNILGLLDRPTAGSYLLEGVDTASLTSDERAYLRSGRIGFVFQSFNLLGRLDAVDNVMLPLLNRGDVSSREARSRAANVLRRVGLASRLSHRPPEMSGGERQRVAIARAIVTEPAVVLADEPTGNLDSKTGEAILDLLDEISGEGRTLVVVTHDEVVGNRAARVIRMRDGRVESGEPA